MARILLPVLLLTLTLMVTIGDKTKRKCIESDFRSYTHSIRKRDANHWCSAQGCTTCEGNVCQDTCKGFQCGACPSGNCCNGTNCNACYNSHCCSTPSCNYCISTCRQACSSQTSCLNNCVPQCQNDSNDVFVVPLNNQVPGPQEVVVYIKGVPYKGHVTSGQIATTNKTATVTVDGVDHSATILTLLPTTQPNPSPSQPCVNNPSKGKCCDEVNCNSCFQNCNSGGSKKCLTKPQWKQENKTLVYNHPAVNRFNVTTEINITNIINNTNKIDSPIFLNKTNFNNFTLPILGVGENQRIIYQNRLQQGCCHVVHPQQCYNNQVYPYRHCVRRTHQECSNLCTSQFVHLAPNLAPQPQRRNQCHYINSYPYVYCGQHTLQNCDPCYVCNGQYNPNSCVQQNGCSNICRKTFTPPHTSQFQAAPSNAQQIQPVQPYQQPGSYRVVHPGSPEYQQLVGLLQNQQGQVGGAPVQYG